MGFLQLPENISLDEEILSKMAVSHAPAIKPKVSSFVELPADAKLDSGPSLLDRGKALGKGVGEVGKAAVGQTVGLLENRLIGDPGKLFGWIPTGLSQALSLIVPEKERMEAYAGKSRDPILKLITKYAPQIKDFLLEKFPEILGEAGAPKTEWGKFFAAPGNMPFEMIEKYREPAATAVTGAMTPIVGETLGAAAGTAVGVSPELAMFAGPAVAGKVRRAFIPKSEAMPMPGPRKALPEPADVPLEAEIVPREITGPEPQKALPPSQGFTMEQPKPETVIRKRPEPEAFIKTDQGYQPAFWNEDLQEYVTPLRPSGQKALPPGQGFEMKPPTPKTIVRKGPLPEKIPTGKGVQPKYGEGEPVPYTSEKGFMELPREAKLDAVEADVRPEAGPPAIIPPRQIPPPPVTEVENVGEPLPTPTPEELALRKEKLKLVTKEEPTELDRKIEEEGERRLAETERRMRQEPVEVERRVGERRKVEAKPEPPKPTKEVVAKPVKPATIEPMTSKKGAGEPTGKIPVKPEGGKTLQEFIAEYKHPLEDVGINFREITLKKPRRLTAQETEILRNLEYRQDNLSIDEKTLFDKLTNREVGRIPIYDIVKSDILYERYPFLKKRYVVFSDRLSGMRTSVEGITIGKDAIGDKEVFFHELTHLIRKNQEGLIAHEGLGKFVRDIWDLSSEEIKKYLQSPSEKEARSVKYLIEGTFDREKLAKSLYESLSTLTPPAKEAGGVVAESPAIEWAKENRPDLITRRDDAKWRLSQTPIAGDEKVLRDTLAKSERAIESRFQESRVSEPTPPEKAPETPVVEGKPKQYTPEPNEVYVTKITGLGGRETYIAYSPNGELVFKGEKGLLNFTHRLANRKLRWGDGGTFFPTDKGTFEELIAERKKHKYPDLIETAPTGLEARKAEIGKVAEAPKVEEVWKMTPDQYQSMKGVHQPWIAEISPAQFAGLGKGQKREYEAKRSKEWQASADVKAEWRSKVVAAHEMGEFSLDDPNITKEAKNAIRSAIRIEEEKRSKDALQQAHKENQIKSVDEIKEGDRVFDLMVRQYGIVKKKFKNSVKLELEKEIPIGLGRVSKDLTVNARELQRQSFDDLQESLKKPEPKPPEPTPPQPQPEAKPAPSPVEKGEQLLPGVKVGLEMPKGGIQAKPTLEGTPLGEAARKAEVEKVQPKLAFEPKSIEQTDPELYWTINELRDFVEMGEPGKRLGSETGEPISWGSSYPTFMKNKGWGKEEVLAAIDKGLKGEKLGLRPKLIFDATVKEAKDINLDRAEQAVKDQERQAVMDKDPDFINEDTIKTLTKSVDDEIIGMKEEWREKGATESEINAAVQEAYKTFEGKEGPLDVAGIKKELTEREAPTQLSQPPQTFRQFVESKGEKWPITLKHPKYEELKSAWDILKSQTGRISIPTREEVSEAYERTMGAVGLPQERRESIYQAAVNRFAAIENVEKKAQALGALILPGELPGKRARDYLGISQKVQEVLSNKTYKINAEGKIEVTGEGLKPILEDFDKSVPGKDVETRRQDFNDYFIARRTIEDLQRPKSPWTEEEIVTPAQVDKARQDLKRLRQKYGNDLGAFERIAPRLYDYQKRVLETLVDSGNLSQERFDAILKDNPHYVPFDRILDTVDIEAVPSGGPKAKKPFTEARSPVKRIKGSEAEIHDVVGSIIKNTYRIMDVAERNTVARNVARLKDIPELEMREVEPPMVPVGTVTHKGHIDAKLKKDILDFLGDLKGRYERKVKIGGKRLGYFQEPNRIVSRFASQESIDAHELGHFLDSLYDLNEKLTKRGETAKELRALADLRFEGETTPGFKKYVRKGGEKIAALIDSYVTKPHLLDKVAPKSKAVLEEVISDHPELKKLREIKPSLVYETETATETIFGKSPFKPKGNVIEYFENGERKYLEVPKNLYDSMSGLNDVSSDMLTRILSIPAHTLRTGVTSTPEFMVRNVWRDQLDAIIQTNVGFRPGIDTIGALADIMKQTEVYHDWLRSGGAHSTFVDLSRKNLERVARDLRKDKSALRYLNIINDAQRISQAIEQSTRLGVFKAAKRKGLSDVEAAFEAREATVDFGVRGSSKSLRTWSSITAFFNPAIQGTARMIRAHRQAPFKTALKAAAILSVPSAILWAVNHDDPDYKEIPQWQKDLFWLIKVGDKDSAITYVRIPKPFLFGQVYGSAVERFLDYASTRDPKAVKGFFRSLVDAATPVQGDPNGVLLPTGAKPLIENSSNWQFFREAPVVPESREDLPPFMQYGKYTTETAKELGKALGYSPAKLENLIRGVTGGAGQYALEATDILTGAVKPHKEGKRPREWADVPLVKGFVTRPLESSPQSLTDFYENAKEIEAGYKGYVDSLKNMKSEDAQYILKKYPKMFLSPSVTGMRENISMINKQIEMLSKSQMPELSKRIAIRKAEELRLKIAQQANKMMEAQPNP